MGRTGLAVQGLDASGQGRGQVVRSLAEFETHCNAALPFSQRPLSLLDITEHGSQLDTIKQLFELHVPPSFSFLERILQPGDLLLQLNKGKHGDPPCVKPAPKPQPGPTSVLL